MADGEDKDGEDTDIECNVRLRAIVTRITRLGRVFTRNSDSLQ